MRDSVISLHADQSLRSSRTRLFHKHQKCGEQGVVRVGVPMLLGDRDNQAFSSPTTEEPQATTLASGAQQNTPRFAHTGDGAKRRWANTLCSGQSPEPKANQRNRGKNDYEKTPFKGNIGLVEDH